MNNSADFAVNLHTHCKRCRHASGSVADYCQVAVDKQIGILGFSDHSPFPDGKYQDSRMYFAELPDYVAEVDAARKSFPQLTLLTGLEADYRPELGSQFYREVFREQYGLQYLLAGVHFAYDAQGAFHSFWHRADDDSVALALIKQTVAAIESGCFDAVAHPDAFGHSLTELTPEVKSAMRDIVEAAKAYRLPLEINANGYRKGIVKTSTGERYNYPLQCFWDLVAEAGDAVEVIVGADAHQPERLGDDAVQKCLDFAAGYGFKDATGQLAKRLLDRAAK